jgi:hypothetical protein
MELHPAAAATLGWSRRAPRVGGRADSALIRGLVDDWVTGLGRDLGTRCSRLCSQPGVGYSGTR